MKHYHYIPMTGNDCDITKDFAIEQASDWVKRDTRVVVGIYKLVAIVRGHGVAVVEEVRDGEGSEEA